MTLPYLGYMIVSIALILLFLQFEENKRFMTLILFWLFTYPIFMNPDYTISIDVLGIDIQPNRLLFLVLGSALFWALVKKVHLNIYDKQPLIPKFNTFEVCMIAYVVINILSLLLNAQEIEIRKVIKESTDLLVFLFVYFFAKNHVSQKDLYLLSMAILIFGLLSSIVGLYQFFVDPDFLRVGRSRPAFGSYTRANGLFQDEYDQGMFLVFVFIICWEAFPHTIWRVLMFTAVASGVFVTMHRLSWVALILAFIGVNLLSNLKRIPEFIPIALLVLTVGLGILIAPFSKPISNNFINTLLAERVEDDTLSVRFHLMGFAIKMIERHPMGIGEFWTPSYNQEAYKFGVPFAESGALIIHNGFLSAGVRCGILGITAFIAFIISTLIFFAKQSRLFGKQWFLPLFILLLYSLFNMTNDFSFWGTQINVFFALLIGSFAGQIELRANAAVAASTAGEYQSPYLLNSPVEIG